MENKYDVLEVKAVVTYRKGEFNKEIEESILKHKNGWLWIQGENTVVRKTIDEVVEVIEEIYENSDTENCEKVI